MITFKKPLQKDFSVCIFNLFIKSLCMHQRTRIAGNPKISGKSTTSIMMKPLLCHLADLPYVKHVDIGDDIHHFRRPDGIYIRQYDIARGTLRIAVKINDSAQEFYLHVAPRDYTKLEQHLNELNENYK